MSGVRPTVVISSSSLAPQLRPGSRLFRAGCRERVRKCSIRWTGFSEPKGSWNTICSWDRYSLRCLEPVPFQDVGAVEQDLAGGGLFQPGNAAGQGALAGAGLAHEGHDFAAADGQVHPAEGPDGGPGEQAAAGEILDQAPHLEGWGFGGVWPVMTVQVLIVRLLARTAVSSLSLGTKRVQRNAPGAASWRSAMLLNFTPSARPVSGTRGPVSGGNAPISACV